MESQPMPATALTASAPVHVTRPRPNVAMVTIASKPLGVLSGKVRAQLLEALRELEHDGTVRAVVLTGSGSHFSVGSDVREFQQSAEWLEASEAAEVALNEHVDGSRLPYIAALNGVTLGGGMVLALACDIRIAHRSISLGLPEVKVGTFASAGGTQRLPALIGRSRAMLLLLTGRMIDSDEAANIGLVDEVTEGDVVVAALDLASEIAALPPAAVEATKMCVATGQRDGIAAGMAEEATRVVSVGLTDDAAEGQRAFLQKRPPNFAR